MKNQINGNRREQRSATVKINEETTFKLAKKYGIQSGLGRCRVRLNLDKIFISKDRFGKDKSRTWTGCKNFWHQKLILLAT